MGLSATASWLSRPRDPHCSLHNQQVSAGSGEASVHTPRGTCRQGCSVTGQPPSTLTALPPDNSPARQPPLHRHVSCQHPRTRTHTPSAEKGPASLGPLLPASSSSSRQHGARPLHHSPPDSEPTLRLHAAGFTSVACCPHRPWRWLSPGTFGRRRLPSRALFRGRGSSGPGAVEGPQNHLVWPCRGNRGWDWKFNTSIAGSVFS